MLPEVNLDTNIKIINTPSKTFKIDTEKNRITQKLDNYEALAQSIYKILNTNRYTYPIYDWNYGIELDDLFGMPLGYVKAELERRVKDSIEVDDRVQSVENFIFSKGEQKGDLVVKFTVNSIFGQLNLEWEVNI